MSERSATSPPPNAPRTVTGETTETHTPEPESAVISSSGEAPVSPPVHSSKPAHPHHLHHHGPAGILPAVQSLSYIIVVAVFIVTFSLQPFRIPSPSMEPTLLVGDFLLVDKQEPRIGRLLNPFPHEPVRRGDIVVFHYPPDPTLHLVKRVVGMPGDSLRMREGQVFINGKPLREPYAVYSRSHPDSFRDNFPHLASTDPDVDAHWWTELHRLVERGELRIPKGSYFVLGDNRNDSEDSRYWGLVPEAAIVGEPFLVYFSLRGDDEGDTAGDTADALTPTPERRRRSLGEALVDLARWDRTMHVVR